MDGRDQAGDYRLVFPLPPTFMAPVGRHSPCLAGCVLTINKAGHCEIIGPSRERVFDQANRFLRMIGRGQAPVSIAATLTTPPSRDYRGGKDSWTIVCEARIAFCPTGMPVEVFAA